jgi:hypothetical protein
MILIVAYDLHNPGRDYEKVAAALRASDGGWAHPQGSVWLIDTRDEPSAWRDRLSALGDSNDEFLVTRLQHNWASRNTDQAVNDWLKDPRRRW